MNQETIRQLIEALRDEKQYHPNDFCRTPMFFVDAEAGKMIADALERTQWIPCEERLPEDAGTYIVSQTSGWVSEAYWNNDGEGFNEAFQPRWEFEAIWCNPIGDGVLAWMPMPEAYKPKVA